MANFIDVAIIGAGPAGMAAAVDAENNALLVKGAVPGPNNSIVEVKASVKAK